MRLFEFSDRVSIAKEVLEKASLRVSLGGLPGKECRLSRLGFTVLPEDDQNPSLQYKYFSTAPTKDIGMIPLPTIVLQSEVSKSWVQKLVDMINVGEKIKPIKVIRVGNDFVVVDGHHRLAAIKVLGINEISALEVESASM